MSSSIACSPKYDRRQPISPTIARFSDVGVEPTPTFPADQPILFADNTPERKSHRRIAPIVIDVGLQ
jgi:hypothetical protein